MSFGGWRTTPTAGLTDIGFAGHRHNNIGTGTENLELIYMNARWYVSSIGRFASADTLVPDPQNPQQYNRYTYTLNNPLKYVDPTGHCTQYGGENGNADALQACLDAWNALGDYYCQITGCGEGYPSDFMNWLLENATTEDLLGILGGFGIAKDPLSGAFKHTETSQTSCFNIQGGGQVCSPEGGWPKYYSLTEAEEAQLRAGVVGFLIKTPISLAAGAGVTGAIGKLVKDPVKAWLVSLMVRRTIVNPIIHGAYSSFTEKRSEPLKTDLNPIHVTSDLLGPVNPRLETSAAEPSWQPKGWTDYFVRKYP